MRFYLLLITLALSACANFSTNSNYTQTVSSWRWAKADALLQSWGQPTQISKLPNGNRVFLYYKESYKSYPSQPITSSYSSVNIENGHNVVIAPSINQTPPPNVTYRLQCTTLFEVDPQRIIVDARASGNNCSGDMGFMMSRSNPQPVAGPRKRS